MFSGPHDSKGSVHLNPASGGGEIRLGDAHGVGGKKMFNTEKETQIIRACSCQKLCRVQMKGEHFQWLQLPCSAKKSFQITISVMKCGQWLDHQGANQQPPLLQGPLTSRSNDTMAIVVGKRVRQVKLGLHMDLRYTTLVSLTSDLSCGCFHSTNSTKQPSSYFLI